MGSLGSNEQQFQTTMCRCRSIVRTCQERHTYRNDWIWTHSLSRPRNRARTCLNAISARTPKAVFALWLCQASCCCEISRAARSVANSSDTMQVSIVLWNHPCAQNIRKPLPQSLHEFIKQYAWRGKHPYPWPRNRTAKVLGAHVLGCPLTVGFTCRDEVFEVLKITILTVSVDSTDLPPPENHVIFCCRFRCQCGDGMGASGRCAREYENHGRID
jgi:hypothetical protein